MLDCPFVSDERLWFAIQTWPKHEKKVGAELTRKEIEVFLPLCSTVRQWSDRRRMVDFPLFPTYLFARIPWTLDARTRVLRTNGVLHIIGSRGAGEPVPESEIESVRTLVGCRAEFHNYPFLNTGQRVRIRGSSLDGIEGILVAKNNDMSLVVSVRIIQRSLAIRVAGYRVEAA
jgi:transcription termination/antitermination protein NusG